MDASEVTAVLREAFASQAGVELAILFGSRARGTARRDSDVDVAVVAREVDLLALAAELSRVLEREVDVVDRGGEVGFPLLEEIVRDGVVVHEGRSGAGARWRAQAWTSLETDRPWFERMRDAFLRRLARSEANDGQTRSPRGEAG